MAASAAGPVWEEMMLALTEPTVENGATSLFAGFSGPRPLPLRMTNTVLVRLYLESLKQEHGPGNTHANNSSRAPFCSSPMAHFPWICGSSGTHAGAGNWRRHSYL